MARSSPVSVGDLLGRSALLAEHTAGISLQIWQRVVGARLASSAIPAERQGDTLTVTVASSAWAQELSLLSGLVLERLRAEGHNVTRLRFRVAPMGSARGRPARVVRVARERLPTGLEEQLSRIGDAELRSSLTQAAAFSLGRQRR